MSKMTNKESFTKMILTEEEIANVLFYAADECTLSKKAFPNDVFSHKERCERQAKAIHQKLMEKINDM